jgi:phosphatidylglycerol:prolipoprotein diacylglycerol transferase
VYRQLNGNALKSGRTGMTIDIDPVIGTLGPLTFRWYRVLMMLGVAVGVVIFADQLRRRGISPDHAWGIAVIAVPCGAIGARLVHVFENLRYFWENPGEIFGLQLVGLAIYGVVGGGLVGLFVYCRWKKLPLLKVLDSTALAFPVGQIIGKFANIINGDTWGNPTDLPWGFTYVNPDSFIPDRLLGVPTHPNPMYEQIWLLVILVVMLVSLRRIKIDGMGIVMYLGLYSLGRFFLSYLRVNKILFWGLREAQVIALVLLVLSIAAAAYLLSRPRKTPRPTAARTKKSTASR